MSIPKIEHITQKILITISTICLLWGCNAKARPLLPVETTFTKGKLLYKNDFSDAGKVADWVMEGPGKLEFKEDWMHMYVPEEAYHHVFWCPEDFPASFIAEWEAQNLETDAGLCILFFAAKGVNGEDILDPSLPERDGTFSDYTQGKLNNYHISYYANNPGYEPDRGSANLRKNAGFDLVQTGNEGVPTNSEEIHKTKLIKEGAYIVMYVDDRRIIDWTDDGQEYGPVHRGGKIGFRQMQWTHFRYRNFKVWELGENTSPAPKSWTRHTIDASSSGADGVKLADINEDGQPDIVTGWEEGGITKLYLHPGKDKVANVWPAVVVGKTPGVEDAVFADMNADGQWDVVSCTENASEKIFVHWPPQKDFLNPEKWKQEVLPASDGLMMWMYAEPVQLDAQHGADLVAAGKGEGAALGWFEAPEIAGDLSKWTWHAISPVGWVMSIILRDMDKDGDTDVVISDRTGVLRGCRWLENPGTLAAQRQAWKNHFIGAKGLEIMFMEMADTDGDGIEEAVVTERSDQKIRIYKRDNETGTEWKEQIIALPASTGTAKSVAVGDMNGDGANDLVHGTNTYGEDKVGLTWIDGKNLSDSSDIIFQSISEPINVKFDKVVLVDLDSDGDLDVLTCEENHGVNSEGLGVIWYENPFK